ncbi:MAG: superoxide dismutase family protein [Parasphingorhabdus sp.]|nr:superoxide dismutase family protein [Parasphingorhabdus sp.]
MTTRVSICASLLVLSACSYSYDTGTQAPSAVATAEPATPDMVAVAILTGADGTAHGEATVTQSSTGLTLRVAATGLAPGLHGAHIHQTGNCDAPAFTTAGGHWNPSGKQHGLDNPAGSHMGDFTNLTIKADGTGVLEAQIPNGVMAGKDNALLDADGAAFIIHAEADDQKSDPSGNSGARVACGIFRAT